MAELPLPPDHPRRLEYWRQLGWVELTSREEDAVWARFGRKFGSFAAGLREPVPSLTWDIIVVFEGGEQARHKLEADLNEKVLGALEVCTRPEERVYALDWLHPCFWFDPRGGVYSGDPDQWAVPVLPDGDHYLFLARDFRFGLLGLMGSTICVFGPCLLEALADDPPAVFRRLVRKDGVAV